MEGTSIITLLSANVCLLHYKVLCLNTSFNCEYKPRLSLNLIKSSSPQPFYPAPRRVPCNLLHPAPSPERQQDVDQVAGADGFVVKRLG